MELLFLFHSVVFINIIGKCLKWQIDMCHFTCHVKLIYPVTYLLPHSQEVRFFTNKILIDDRMCTAIRGLQVKTVSWHWVKLCMYYFSTLLFYITSVKHIRTCGSTDRRKVELIILDNATLKMSVNFSPLLTVNFNLTDIWY